MHISRCAWSFSEWGFSLLPVRLAFQNCSPPPYAPIASLCQVRNYRQHSYSILPSPFLLFNVCLTSWILTGVWLKRTSWTHSLWKWHLSRKYKAAISTFGESYKPFDSYKSAYSTDGLISGFAMHKPLSFLYHSALKYLSLWPNNPAVSFLSRISCAALPVSMSRQQTSMQSEPACLGSTVLVVLTVSASTELLLWASSGCAGCRVEGPGSVVVDIRYVTL